MIKYIKIGNYEVSLDQDDYDRFKDLKISVRLVKSRKRYVPYVRVKIPHRKHEVGLHRLIMGEPAGKIVDHKDHNTLDNRKDNLRICTKAQNGYNSRTYRGTSQYKGVFWSSQKNRWSAKIGTKHLGFFKIEEHAALAYNREASIKFGEFAFLNSISEN